MSARLLLLFTLATVACDHLAGAPPEPASYPLCPGAVLQQSSRRCRWDADCARPGERCLDAAPACLLGAQPAPRRSCETDADCSGGVCAERPTCAPLPDSSCLPRCTPTSCAPGESCGGDGRCGATPCTAGHACGPAERCEPANRFADAHGCRPLTCTEGQECAGHETCTGEGPRGCAATPCALDQDCGCGTCVQGRCAPRPGICVYLLVP